MARKVLFLDDLTGEEGAEERVFAIGENVYEADLVDSTWTWYQDVLGPLVEASKQIGTMRGTEVKRFATPRKPPETSDERHSREELDQCRAWCDANRIKLPSGGGKIATAIWQGFALKDPSVIPDKWHLAEGEENGAVALAVQRRGLVDGGQGGEEDADQEGQQGLAEA